MSRTTSFQSSSTAFAKTAPGQVFSSRRVMFTRFRASALGKRNLFAAPGLFDQVPLTSNTHDLASPYPAAKPDSDLAQIFGENLEHGRMEQRHVLEFSKEFQPRHTDKSAYLII